MSKIEMYVTDSLYMNAEKVGNKKYIIHLSNGKDIEVEKEPEHNGSTWAWRVNGQLFSRDDYAFDYLKEVIFEKLTGKRIIYHGKREVPNICGVNGAACRAKGKCNTALCSTCPVAEQFEADRDGVELIYAV